MRLSAPGYERLLKKDYLNTTFCGSEANVAVALSILGIDTVFLSKLPKNEIGYQAKRVMNYYGVDTKEMLYDHGRMGVYYLEKGISQRPSKIIYDRKYSTFSQIQIEDFNWEKIFRDITWFHWTGITPSLSDNLIQVCIDACTYARKKGITISCDLNYRSKLWTTQKANLVMDKLMPYVNICIANEEDVEKIFNIKANNLSNETTKIDRRSYKEVAQKMCEKYCFQYIAFSIRESFSANKNSWSGILYNGLNKQISNSSKYKIDIVDRVGAGDSFAAGIIYSIMNKKGDQEVIEFATALSCLKHTIEGDFCEISFEEVECLMKGFRNGRIQR